MSKNSERNGGRAAQGGAAAPNKENGQLRTWQERLSLSDQGYAQEVAKMDRREKLYRGDNSIKKMVEGDKTGSTTCHVRNIIFENIESQISSTFPQPKVTPRRKQDEGLAARIEHFLRNELERMPFDVMNDMAERTVPIQGGVGFLTEWDNTKRTHSTVGAVEVSLVHPKQFGPQPGVYTSISDMDWFIIKIPTTKEAVFREYGKSVYAEGEAEPELRGTGDEDLSNDIVTKYAGYEKGENGGYNKFVWVNDVILEDLPDYQARRQPTCTGCGRVRPLPGQVIQNRENAGNLLPDPVTGFAGGLIPEEILELEAAGHALAQQMALSPEGGAMAGIDLVPGEAPPDRYDGGPCPWCGCEDFTDEVQEFEQVMLPIETGSGLQIPGNQPGFDENGQPVMKPTLVPFYKPDLYPIVLQRSVSVYGQLLGNSDVDAIEDQQNTINRLEQKIIDRLLKAGSRITLPDRADFRVDPEDGERWYIGSPAEKQMIDVYDFKGDLQYELAYLSVVYEEARQILGITDSFQGRRDPTATSGVAKEYSAAQAAGRLESKRVMKNAAYAQLFELIFKNWLAYSDEPRPVSYKNDLGETEYEQFSRYDFLEKDADGQYWWNDQFLFSCDSAAPLASNREAMWQETRMNLQTGAFGDPAATDTLILFWSKMEELHYPGAAQTKKHLEERLKREQQAQMQQMQLQMQMQLQGRGGMPGNMAAQQVQAGTI